MSKKQAKKTADEVAEATEPDAQSSAPEPQPTPSTDGADAEPESIDEIAAVNLANHLAEEAAHMPSDWVQLESRRISRDQKPRIDAACMTEALELPHGCLVKDTLTTTGQQGDLVVSTVLAFVPGVRIGVGSHDGDFRLVAAE